MLTLRISKIGHWLGNSKEIQNLKDSLVYLHLTDSRLHKVPMNDELRLPTGKFMFQQESWFRKGSKYEMWQPPWPLAMQGMHAEYSITAIVQFQSSFYLLISWKSKLCAENLNLLFTKSTQAMIPEIITPNYDEKCLICPEIATSVMEIWGDRKSSLIWDTNFLKHFRFLL